MLGTNGGLIGGVRTTSALGSGIGLWTPNEQAALRRNRSWPLSGDPFYSYASLLLPMNGSNGSTTFTDSSPYAATVTVNGNAQISTTQNKFGGASGYFDGTGDYLTVGNSPAFDYGSGDFTIEYWGYFASASEVYVYSKRAASANYTAIACGVKPSAGTLYVIFAGSTTGSSWNINGTFGVGTIAIPLNTWTHLAYVRSGSTIKAYVNGVGDLTVSGVSGSLMSNAANVSIAASDLTGSNSVNGYIDDLRITKGIARYTANFTPPAQAFLTYGGYNDPYFVTTSLLLHMDGSNNSTPFTDSSLNALAVTANGNAQISTTDVKYGSGCGLFDGTGDTLTLSDTDLLEFGAENYTIEMWINTTQTTQYATLFSRMNGAFTNGSWTLLINNSGTSGGEVAWWAQNHSIAGPMMTTSGVSVIDGAYHHIAVVRNASSHVIYVDGVSRATATASYTISNVALGVTIAGDANYGRNYNGRIDDLRITKGVARYTANFTPPAAPFPDA